MLALAGIALSAFGLGCAVVTLLKGQYFLAALGLVLCGLPWIVGAVVPPAPASWWARRFPEADPFPAIAPKDHPNDPPHPRVW